VRARIVTRAVVVTMAAALLSLEAPAPASAQRARRAAQTPAFTPSSAQRERLREISVREGNRDTTGLAGWLQAESAPEMRAVAARSLGRIQNRGSVPALTRALDDPSALVRRQAAFALGLVGDSTAAPALLRRLDVETDAAARTSLVSALGDAGGRKAAPALVRALRGKDAAERRAAALAAARLRDSTLVDALADASRDASPDVRWRSAYALGRIGDRLGASTLRRLTDDKSEIVRYHSARALGEVGDSSATPRLVALLHDPAWRVRTHAAQALGALRARRDARSLYPLLRDRHPHVRWQAAISLGSIQDSSSVRALTEALRDSSSGVVQAAATALLQIQGEAAVVSVAPALDLLPGFLRSGLIESLGSVPGSLALSILTARAADSTDAPLQAGAATALGKRPADRARALEVLRPLLAARDFTVVCSAAEALGALGDTVSIPAIAGLLRRSGSPEEGDIRTSAATALAALKTSPALDALRVARTDPERRIREIASTALGLPADSIAASPAPRLRVEPVPSSPAVSASIETSRGVIRIALDSDRAPRTVENFSRLARSGYFDGITFHRVVPDFVIQDGCPRGDGWGGPGYVIPCEYNDRPYEAGTVGMALSGKDTGGSQWFVTLAPAPRLDGRYTAFGSVTSGMEIVERIMPGDRIVRVTVR
jgi:HEAT repeat protein/cyclophilin family peptidyl-prolyl cis-trans isomerase